MRCAIAPSAVGAASALRSVSWGTMRVEAVLLVVGLLMVPLLVTLWRAVKHRRKARPAAVRHCMGGEEDDLGGDQS